MAWLALALAIVALPTVLLDQRWAWALLLTAGTLGVVALLRGQGGWPPRVALALALAVAIFAGWSAWLLHRPDPDLGPDLALYQRVGASRDVALPLVVELAPITKLALLPLAPGSDEIYNGFEPQWLADEQGFRVIAYRHDGYVDFYLDDTLTLDPGETSQVTGKGINRLVQTDLGDPKLEVDAQGRANISFAFTDIAGREIALQITEGTPRRSVPTNLLAPIGTSAADPDSFPLILLNDFEFIRTSGSVLELSIDGKPLTFESFPVPLPVQGQLRNFAKYTLDAEVISLFPSSVNRFEHVRTAPGTDCYQSDGVRYLFDGDALERILVNQSEIVFSPALDIATTSQGRFEITSYPQMGVISGPYRVAAQGAGSELEISIDQVQVPHQRDLMYRLIVNNRSLFADWPKHYRYQASIDRATGVIDARWHNDSPGG